ncbi:alpha/beta fold hydrolase [Chroococcidiopsis sp. FACHB-1243]|uniref:alpha/beta fold hydrolase n=1 Tax=Chroococcidiopsis sp. [FACHB-1243] TaxID=2692781 RepID=UPI001782FEE5|nr:alpha/beta fold hydrolase [Chroococcidiopsis sp. [FACHB-1243]]MBD2304057.1 alpha/beta fold hydrolase [Chroococcidiopsis sp. [FACHB-1243]]
MFPSFLPSQVQLLQQPESIALAQKIERSAIATPIHSGAIVTSFVRQGEGNIPILLLHGFDSSVLEFRRLIPLLAAQHETWAVDLLGFGFSDRPRGINYNPETIKSHLYDFWKTLIDKPVILVGASMGGATAIDFVLTYPQAVKYLVLINSIGFSGDFPLGQFLFFPLDYLAVEFWRQRKIQALNLGTSLGKLTSFEIDAIRCALLHTEMSGWSEAMVSFTKSGGYGEIANKIAKVDKPTTILWGDRDETLGVADAMKFKQAIARSQLIWLKNCGHVPQIEQPEIIANYIGCV